MRLQIVSTSDENYCEDCSAGEVPILEYSGIQKINCTVGDALAVNVGLTIFYIVYAYGFYLLYDHFRPTHGLRDRQPRGVSQ